MAIKNVVTDGLMGPVNYVVTEGFGNLAASSTSSPPKVVAPAVMAGGMIRR